MTIQPTRRRLLATTASMVAAPVLAQARWPGRTIRIIVPFAPGASIDAIARILAPKLTATLGVPVVVENRSGAGGMVGSGYVARQPADGYTLLFTSNPFLIAPLLLPPDQAPSYDPVKDFTPISEVASAPLVITAGADLNVASLGDLLALARSSPQGLNYGSAGIGTINHLAVAMLAQMAGVELVHVPFGGLGPAMTALLGGQVQMMAGTIPSVLPLVRDGRVRALAVTGAQRSALLPDVPTVTEAGIAGYELDAWWGLLGPSRLPSSITERLSHDVKELLKSDEVRQFLTLEGAMPLSGMPDELSTLIRTEIPRWRLLVHDLHING